jgi:hypothetical protein
MNTAGWNLRILDRKKAQPRSVHVGFVVNSEAMGQVFSQHFGFSPFTIIPPSSCATLYNRTNVRSMGTLEQSNALSDIGGAV